jgi:hypothetical protein
LFWFFVDIIGAEPPSCGIKRPPLHFHQASSFPFFTTSKVTTCTLAAARHYVCILSLSLSPSLSPTSFFPTGDGSLLQWRSALRVIVQAQRGWTSTRFWIHSSGQHRGRRSLSLSLSLSSLMTQARQTLGD